MNMDLDDKKMRYAILGLMTFVGISYFVFLVALYVRASQALATAPVVSGTVIHETGNAGNDDSSGD